MDSPRLSGILTELAEVIAELRPDDAEVFDLLERNLRIENTTENRSRIARHQGALQNHERSIEGYLDTIRIESSAPYPSAMTLARLHREVAEQFVALGRLVEAEESLLQQVELRTAHYGENHPQLAYALRDLAAFYVETERWLEAEVLLEQADALNIRAWGPAGNACACNTSDLLSQVHAALGREGATPTLDKQAPAAVKETKDDPRIAQIRELETSAQGQLDRGDADDARKSMDEALALRQDVYGADSLGYASGLSRYGRLLRDQGRYGDAFEMYARRLAVLESLGKGDSSRVLDTLQGLSLTARMERRYDDAESYFAREIAGREALGQQLRVAQIHETRANARLLAGDGVGAQADFQAAIDRWTAIVGEDAPEIIRLRTGIARSQLRDNRAASAAELLAANLAAEEARIYPELRTMIQILSPLKNAHDRLGEVETARQTAARLKMLRDVERGVVLEGVLVGGGSQASGTVKPALRQAD